MLLLSLALVLAARANATSDCGAALQLQDTVRSSLRSEDTAQSVRDLVAEHKAISAGNREAMQKLQDAMTEHRTFTEKAAAEQKSAAEKAVAEQRYIALSATAEMRIYLLLAVPACFGLAYFLAFYPQRAVAILRAYIGPQQPPP